MLDKIRDYEIIKKLGLAGLSAVAFLTLGGDGKC